MALFQAQTEIDPKMATQADSLFRPVQSHVVMTTLGCCKIYIYYILSIYLIHAYMPYLYRVTLSDMSQL